MSYPRQEVSYESYPRVSTQRLAKPPVHMPVLSPREKRLQYNVNEPELSSLYKKSQLSHFSASPKAEVLTGLKPSNKESSVEDRNHVTGKLTVDRMKSLSINTAEKSGISSTSKFVSKTPRNIDIEPRFNPQSTHNENITQKKNAVLQSNFENFVSRYSKLVNTLSLPNPQPLEFSAKSYNQVKAYASCTNQGLVRNYNEDRVTTALNLTRPINKNTVEKWPSCHVFCVFDGHGGERCANFLQERIHYYIINSQYFPWNPEEALREACEVADREFLEIALAAEQSETRKHDKSGSCGLIMLILDNKCYLCNVGDSRAVLSQSLGDRRFALTRDHKPNDPLEKQRILEAGGKIYQNFPTSINGKRMDQDPSVNPANLNIPFRISPGRLSISRSFGDIEAKLPEFGGNPHVLICQPEITTLPLTDEIDFVVMGSDGIYDVLSNEELVEIVWNSVKNRKKLSLHEAMKFAAEDIIKEALLKKSLDNVTALVVCFNNLGFEAKQPDQILTKSIIQNDPKIQKRWNDAVYEEERAQTERRRPSKSLKRGYRGQNIISPEEKIGGSVIEEIGSYKPNQSYKVLTGSPTMKFAKVGLDKRQLNYEVRPTIDFPKIIKLRTPR